MGLFNTLKNVGAAAYDGLQKNAEEIQKIKTNLERCSDEQLFCELRRGSPKYKIACASLLQERGYSQDEISDARRS